MRKTFILLLSLPTAVMAEPSPTATATATPHIYQLGEAKPTILNSDKPIPDNLLAPKTSKDATIKTRPQLESLLKDKKQKDVVALLGKPSETHQSGGRYKSETWIYRQVSKDPVSDKIDVSMEIHFGGRKDDFSRAPMTRGSGSNGLGGGSWQVDTSKIRQDEVKSLRFNP